MKEKELRESSDCGICKNKIGTCGIPLFWRVTIERFGLDARAIQKQDGLGAMLGNSVLASFMGPDEDLARAVMEPIKVILCEKCAIEQKINVAVLGLKE